MASCTVVNVQCPNGRRQKVKLTAHMTLLQVIQEVCKKQDLDSNKYNLKHQRKSLDSSLTIRFANLPNHAHLELVESADGQPHSAKKCVVALQLENGERLVHEFTSDVSLLSILMHWKYQSESVTFDDTLDGVVCIFANQQIRGLEKLKTTTLSMIGLNGGRGVIRLIQPSVSKPDRDETVIGGDNGDKVTKQPEVAIPRQESPIVEAKQSSEEMEVASACTSSMSVASQVSEDGTTETLGGQSDQAGHIEILSSQPEKNGGKNDDTMDFEQTVNKLSESSQSETGDLQPKKKRGKTQDAMETEQFEVRTVVGGGEIGSRSKVDGKTQEDPSPPLVESVASTSDGRTSRSATAVQAFSGQGRTLSEAGPDVKKPRFHSPPSSSYRTNEESQQSRNAKFSNARIPEREPVVFRLGDSNSLSSDDVSDEFFEVTVDDLRLMLKDLKNERTAEKPLMTTKMREERERSKMEQYERVTIRVYFPDRTVLQGFFSPTETVSAVASFVNDNLQQKDTNFYLYTTPPRTMLDQPNSTLFEAKLFPAAIVHFGSSETQGTYLHSRHLQDMADFTSANEKVDRYNRSSSCSSTHEIETDSPERPNNVQTNQAEQTDQTTSAPAQQVNESRENAGENKGKSVPKWFKLGK